MPSARYVINSTGFLILGTLNNVVYVVIGSAAQEVARYFGMGKLISLVTWSNVGAGLFVRLLNAFLERVPFAYRVSLALSVLAAGLGVLAASFVLPWWGFFVALVGVVLVGGSSSFSESVMLTYLRLFPPATVNWWSSGTGFAGVVGSLLYLALSAGLAPHLPNALFLELLFTLMAPVVVLYALTYIFVVKRPSSATGTSNAAVPDSLPLEFDEVGSSRLVPPSGSVQDPSSVSAEDAADETEVPLPLSQSLPLENDRLLQSSPLSFRQRVNRWLLAVRLVARYFINLGLVYLFEYFVSVAGADRATRNPTGWGEEHSFAILSLCYQIGVLISRSSLPIVKIRWIEVLTVFQAFNVVLWVLHDIFQFMPFWYAQVPAMVFVGLLGGASYVNVFYLLLQDAAIPSDLRELCINLCALSITTGITSASIVMLLYEFIV